MVGARAGSQRTPAARMGRLGGVRFRGPLQGQVREAPEGDLRMSQLLYGAIGFALGCYAIASVLVLGRLIKGPRAQDRVFALDLLYLHAMLVMLVLGIRHQSDVYF